jgi:hypothetical protein
VRLTNDTGKDLRDMIECFNLLSMALQDDMAKMKETERLSGADLECLVNQFESCRDHLMSVCDGPDLIERTLVVSMLLTGTLFNQWIEMINAANMRGK